MDFGSNVNKHNDSGSESFRVWVPNFDDWPKSWMGNEKDLVYGRQLLSWFSCFLQALHDDGMAKKTFAQYRDNLWLLGGTIIREVSLNGGYQDDPLEKLVEAVADDGILPDHSDQMSEVELEAFERMCRRFKKYLGKRHETRSA